MRCDRDMSQWQFDCANYYAEPSRTIPMVPVGRDHWTQEVGVWDLLRSLGAGRAFSAGLALVDHAEEVLPLLVQDRGDRR